MSEVTDKLVEVLRAVAMEEIAVSVVQSISQVRQWAETVSERDKDLVGEAVFLHQLSINLDRLQEHVARARNIKLAKLRDDKKMAIGEIAKRTTIERTLVQKLIRKGRDAR